MIPPVPFGGRARGQKWPLLGDRSEASGRGFDGWAVTNRHYLRRIAAKRRWLHASNGDGNGVTTPYAAKRRHLSTNAAIFFHFRRGAMPEPGTWDYRVVRNGDVLAIHEVFFDDDGEIAAITADPIEPRGETLDGLRQDLTWMLEALEHPILEYDDPERQARGDKWFAKMESEPSYELSDEWWKRQGRVGP